MGYTEDRIAEFKEEVRKARTDWEREHWATRLAHAEKALQAEKGETKASKPAQKGSQAK